MAPADRAVAAMDDRARALCDAVVRETGDVVAVFVGGSVARGEVAWFEGEDLEIYSDLDLYVVVSEDADAGAAREVARLAAQSVPDVAGVRFLRADDVGVYTRADLFAQPARPGTLGVASHHRTLHGDPSIADALSGEIGTDVDPGEGLYLIENRVLELDSKTPDPSDAARRRLRRYVLMKSALDVATALLIGRGCFAVGMSERRDAVERLAAAGELPPGWDDDLVARAFDAVADLRRELERPERTGPEGQGLEARVASFALAVWTSIAALVFPDAGRGAASMVAKRCHEGRYDDNAREFLAMAARLGRSKLRMAWTALGAARFSPMASLRVSALAARMAAAPGVDDSEVRRLEDFARYLERLTAACGFGAGDLRDRVNSMYRIVA